MKTKDKAQDSCDEDNGRKDVKFTPEDVLRSVTLSLMDSADRIAELLTGRER